MKGYVYMIDYSDNDYNLPSDQIECYDRTDLLKQVKLIANGVYDDCIKKVVDIKLVNDNDRYLQKEISDTLYKQCKKILGKKWE